ncbi:MAG: hypothetical protein HY904_13210, partial [Deltaproteobacteria bacterium]|nr:hypothetical protein [Deltaproteobacteria bacterium]
MVPTEQLGEGPWTVDARETALTGPAGKRWAVGMPMRVRVTGADEELGRVEFAPG